MPDTLVPIRRALLSVSDKAGLVPLARALAARGVELISTGGTAQALREAGLGVRDVAAVTGFPEMLGGRVKTLHPAVHGGLLALRDDPGHQAALSAQGIGPIDLLVVNLYPFEATVAAGGGYAACVETIDVGGPAMLRAGAKNHRFVTVVTDVEDYGALLEELARHAGATTPAFRQALALTAYGRTAAYDAAVSAWLAETLKERTPRRRSLAGRLAQPLRYGENPHQGAAFYHGGDGRRGVATARQLQGKALSYNNINDTDAAFELVAEFAPEEGPACAIVKHANPCGAARGASLSDAYRAAYDCDRTSAFGGIVALNRELDAQTARAIAEIFTEVVIAPGVSDAAAAVFAARKNLRLLVAGGLPDPAAPGLAWRQVAGGLLVQDRDGGRLASEDLRVVTARAPSAEELRDLLFAWRVAKHVKSNAIVYARGGATVGIGAGQMSRVDSTRIAAQKARDMAAALGLAAPLA
jgi:phosphoribosylaminoimidazolecarboxamide formyltransferase/IMP cyclohydrolase